MDFLVLQYKIIPVTPFEQNCSIIWCDETNVAAVTDPGGDIEKIISFVQEKGLDLKQIILTHAHIDHAGAAATLSEQCGIDIIGPGEDDLFWIQGLPQQSQMFQFAPAKSFIPKQWLKQGDKVSVGHETLEVLHCPGHTPGHVVFFSSTAKLAIVGDVLFQGSIGRTDFPKGDYDTLINSIKERLWPLGDDVHFIPGHGPMSTIGHERLTNPFVADHRG